MLAARIQFVTGNFYQLQGLRLIPFGMLCLARAASMRGLFDWLPGLPVRRPSDLGNAWIVVFWCVVIGVAWAIEDRYRGRFGTVAQHPRTRRNAYIALAIVAFFIGLALDVAVGFPVRLGQLSIAGALLGVVYADGYFRRHYLASAIAWMIVAILPLFDVSPKDVQFASMLCAGVTLMVCGVGDHLLLVNTFTPRGKRLHVAKSATV